MERKKKLG
jgi:glutathione S-transferase